MKNRKAILIKKEIEKLQLRKRKYLDRIQKEIKNKITQLEQCCLHNETITVEPKSIKMFDYVSESIAETKCAVCKKVLNTEVKKGTYA